MEADTVILRDGAGAWLARLASDAVSGGPVVARWSPPWPMRSTSEATEAARITGRLFGQAVAGLHATGEHSPDLEASGADALRAVLSLQSATFVAASELLR